MKNLSQQLLQGVGGRPKQLVLARWGRWGVPGGAGVWVFFKRVGGASYKGREGGRGGRGGGWGVFSTSGEGLSRGVVEAEMKPKRG